MVETRLLLILCIILKKFGKSAQSNNITRPKELIQTALVSFLRVTKKI